MMVTEKRLIDACKLAEQIEETAAGLADCDQQNAAWALRKYGIRDISKAPTVDAVEVVRCKDCKYMCLTEFEFRGCVVWNGINGVGDDGFCNYGERKGNG